MIIADMRFRPVPFALLVIALLALPAVATAGPKPIFKPKDTPAKTSTPTKSVTTKKSSTSTNTDQTPIKKPDTSGSTNSGTKSETTTTGTDAGTTTPKVVVVDVVGRDQSSAEITLPSTGTPTAVAPDPTPLGIVAVGDRVRSHSPTTPAWKLALLALLAAAEAFLVVRLVRHRPGGGLSTAS
jgi:hypothetical protein